jgi:hypothetical protein
LSYIRICARLVVCLGYLTANIMGVILLTFSNLLMKDQLCC